MRQTLTPTLNPMMRLTRYQKGQTFRETKEKGVTVERKHQRIQRCIVLANEVVTGRKAYSGMARMEKAQHSFHVLKIELDLFQLQNERGLLYLYRSATIVKFVDCFGG